MSVFLLFGFGAVMLVVGAAVAAGYARRGALHQRWRLALSDGAERLGGARPSLGTRYDNPELRTEVDGRTVTLRLDGAGLLGRATGSTALGADAPATRLWVGWDVGDAAPDWHHVPTVAIGPTRVDGELVVRSDDAAFAQRVVERSLLDLLDVRQEAHAHGLSVSVRGGHVRIEVAGVAPSGHLVERLARATARLASALPEWARAVQLPAGASSGT